MPDWDVCVVGAGLAGLKASLVLKNASVKVALIEARDRVGGRVENLYLDDGTPLEIGGQWVGPTQDVIYAEIKNFGLSTYPTYNEGENVIFLNGNLKRYKGTIPKLPLPVLIDVGLAISRINSLARHVDTEEPWSWAKAQNLDAITAETWISKNMRTRLGKELMRVGFDAVFAAEPCDVSMLHYLFYVKSAGDLNKLLDVRGGAQQDRVEGGSWVLAQKMAESLGGDSLFLSSPVRAIIQDGNEIRIEAKGNSFSSKYLILALPPRPILSIEFDPPLPGLKDQLLQKLPMGSVIKVMAVYDSPFWRAEGLTGQATSDSAAVRVTFDNSPKDGHVGVLLGFLEGREARAFSGADEKALREEVISSFTRYFGNKASSCETFLFKDWSQEPYTRGCYGAHHPPGVWRAFGQILRKEVGRIYFASTELATTWSGYMDGALRAGQSAAEAVLNRL